MTSCDTTPAFSCPWLGCDFATDDADEYIRHVENEDEYIRDVEDEAEDRD